MQIYSLFNEVNKNLVYCIVQTGPLPSKFGRFGHGPDRILQRCCSRNL